MTLVEIEGVVNTELKDEHFQGRNIEAPKPGSRIDSHAIHVGGWVLGRNSPTLTVEVVHNGTVLQSTELDVPRPDIVAGFPGVSGAEQSGFRTTVAVPDPGDNELIVQAVLQDESRFPLGVIQARRRRSGEEQDGEDSVREGSGPVARFFRRMLGLGDG
jgi:hypothetical protein